MPRYLVERTFPAGLRIPVRAVLEGNADAGVTWVHSYVSEEQRRSFCVYEAPTPEAIRKTASRAELPVDRITEVRVLDPYFYHAPEARSDDCERADHVEMTGAAPAAPEPDVVAACDFFRAPDEPRSSSLESVREADREHRRWRS